jgi:hypothetical protein
MSEARDIATIDDEFAEAKSDPDLEVTFSDTASEIQRRLATEFRSESIAFDQAFVDTQIAIDDTLAEQLEEDEIQVNYQYIEEEFENEEDRKTAELFTAQAEKDKIAGEDRRSRKLMAKKIAALLLGAVVTDALMFYLVKMKNAKCSPTKQFSQSAIDQAAALLDQWRAQSDSVLWNNIADFVDTYSASLQTQMTMMAYIKNWAPDVQITWGPGEKSSDIATLVAAATSRRASSVYRAVMTLTHGGQSLQRQIAADLCEHAIAQILSKVTGGAPQTV